MAINYTIATRFSAIDHMSAVMSKIQARTASLHKSLSTLKGKTGNILQGMGDQMIMRGLTAGAIGIGFLGKNAIETAAKFEAIRTAITFVSGDSENAAANLKFLGDTVRGLKLDYSVTAESFKRFLGAMKATTIPAERQREMFYKMATATRVLGMDGESTERVFYALGEMFSKGQVMSQELKLQLGNALPGAVDMFAKSMGKSQKEFRKMMEAGNVGTEHIGGFIDYVYEQFKEGVPSAIKTMNASLTKLGNDWKMTLEEIGLAMNQAGLLEMISELLGGIKDWVAANKELIASGFKSFLDGVVGAFKWIYNNWDWIVAGLKTWLGAWAVLKVINIGLGLMQTSILAIGTMLSIGGPLIAGIALVAVGVYQIYDNWKRVGRVFDAYKKSVNDFRQPEMNFEDFETFWVNLKAGSFSVIDDIWTRIRLFFLDVVDLIGKIPGMGNLSIQAKAVRTEIEAEKIALKAETQAEYQKYLSGRYRKQAHFESTGGYLNVEAGRLKTKLYDEKTPGYMSAVNPQAAIQRNITETNNNSSLEINVKTDANTTAEVVGNKGAAPVKVTVNNSTPYYLSKQ